MSEATLQQRADGVLQIAGVINFDTALGLRERVQQAIEQAGDVIMLDLSAVTRANSVALSVLLRAAEQAASLGKRFELVGVPAGVQSIAGACGLDAWLRSAEQDA